MCVEEKCVCGVRSHRPWVCVLGRAMCAYVCMCVESM